MSFAGELRPEPLGREAPEREMHDSDGFAQRLDVALRARRIGKMYSLALDLGIDESALSRWRRGRSLSIDNLIRLSRHLGISIDWLLTGAGSMDLAVPNTTAGWQLEIAESLSVLDPATCETFAALMRLLVSAQSANRSALPAPPDAR